MRVTQVEKWLVKRWTKAGLLYRPMEGGANFPAPIQTGIPFIYEGGSLPLPQTTTKTIFTFSSLQYRGGPGAVWIDSLWGVVTTAIGAVANATKLTFIGTDNNGVALSGVDACTTLDINGAAIGTLFAVVGNPATALGSNTGGYASGGSSWPRIFTFGTTGTLQVNCAGSDGGGGRVKWYIACRATYGVQVIPAAS